MARILAIDYGNKRAGIAVTDPLQLIATGLTTLHPNELIEFLKSYFEKEKVDCVVIGEPKQLNNLPSESEKYIETFIKKFKSNFPTVKIERIDERFTSKIAFRTLIDAGLKKKDRRNKFLVDKVSATLILQSYMETKKNQLS